jgi:hypothetical protein
MLLETLLLLLAKSLELSCDLSIVTSTSGSTEFRRIPQVSLADFLLLLG